MRNAFELRLCGGFSTTLHISTATISKRHCANTGLDKDEGEEEARGTAIGGDKNECLSLPDSDCGECRLVVVVVLQLHTANQQQQCSVLYYYTRMTNEKRLKIPAASSSCAIRKRPQCHGIFDLQHVLYVLFVV